MPEQSRRPIASRKITLFHHLAKRLVLLGITPNQVSVASAFFGLAAGIGFYLAGQSIELLANLYVFLAILCIQARLICNLIDGLMAVENGLKTENGELYNEIPDRIADTFIFLGAAYGSAHMLPFAAELGWMAICFALATAYIRTLGAATKRQYFFAGPMAKPQRMFVMTLAGIVSMGEIYSGFYGYSLSIALGIIAIGSFVTCLNRLTLISRAKSSL